MAVTEPAPPAIPSSHPPHGGKRVKTPTVLQMEAVECGAAALGIVLGYYGRYVPLEELRNASDVSRDGANAANVIKAAQAYGLEAAGYRLELDALHQVRFPVIIFWEFSHFLVVEGFDGDTVYLNDPAMGRRPISLEDFRQSFMGVVLVFQPGPNFKKGGKKPSVIAGLKSRLRSSTEALVYAVLIGLVLALLGLIVPAFSRIFIDKFVVRGLADWVPPLLLAMAAASVVMGILTWLQQQTLLRLQTRLAISMSGKLLWHVLRLPIEFFVERQTGEISSRVQLNANLATLLSGSLATNVLGIMTIVVFAVVMFRYDVVLTAVAVVMGALNLAALHYVSRLRVDQNKRLLQEQGRLLGTVMTGLRTIETLKATGSESDFFARWAGYQAKVMNAEQSLGVSTQTLAAVPLFLTALNAAAILVIGGLRVMNGDLSLGTLVAFQVLVASFMAPISGLVSLGSQVQEAEGDLSRLDDVLSNPIDQRFTQPDVPALPGDPAVLTGYLELRNVTFGYNKMDAPLIENFSLSLQPGARIALVGATGSGKSTVANMVTGLIHPWSGDVLFDGRTREQIPRLVMSRSLGVCSQEVQLLSGTVRENLTLWDNTIPQRDVVQAARDAQIHDVIVTRPGGYSSLIDEQGTNFSGGQQQRLTIARSLTANPTIVVMDEATSALDPPTEALVDDALRRRGCTCLIIAHRLSTIRDADEIIVMDHGKVAQRGTHEEMIKAGGPYADLIKAGEYVQAGVSAAGEVVS